MFQEGKIEVKSSDIHMITVDNELAGRKLCQSTEKEKPYLLVRCFPSTLPIMYY